MNFFTIYNIPPLISSILFLILGLFIYFKNRKLIVNLTFLLVCFATFWWQFSWFILFSTQSEFWASYLVKIGYMGIIFIPAIFYHFFVSFLGKTKTFDRYLLYFSYLTGVIFLIFLFFTNYFINGFYNYFWGFYPKANFLHPFYLLLLTVLAIRIIYLLLFNLKEKKIISSYKYNQIKYLLWALIFYIFAASDFIVNYGIEFYPFGFLFILIFIGIIAYTIVVYRLMDIKIILRRSSVYLASLSTIIILAIPIKYVFNRYFIDVAIWADLTILILAISAFPPIKDYYYRIANKYFFSSLYDSREVIANLSDKLRSTLEISKIYKFISDTFINSFHSKAVGILTFDEKTKNYLIRYSKGFNINKNTNGHGFVQIATDWRKMYLANNKSIVVEELKNISYKKYKKIIDTLTNLDIEVLTPLNVKDKTIGLIILGQKESGDMYNDEDLKVLEVTGAQVAIAIENALLYEETKNFASKLKQEVKKATADLRAANKQLKELDAAKSEFISIASHQLRTPLTVIKGYISMMLEGTFGKLTKEETVSLEKVYESNERLIQLVENLLNISRIESGRLQFNFEIMQLEEVVENVVDELAGSAKRKGLRLEYKKSSKPLPKVKIDEEKIRQVVMNLIDNAIKYTKQGGITIKLEQIGKNIQFCVIDTGVGISKEDLDNLFKKFSRGKGSSVIHTEGTGLGLYVGKMMIEAHQGKIWAESKGKDRGARFCFVVPIYKKN